MSCLTDILAFLAIGLVALVTGVGALMQLELLQPGVQVFRQGGTGWQVYSPLSGTPDGAAYSIVGSVHLLLAVVLVFVAALLAACLQGGRLFARLAWTLTLTWIGAVTAIVAYVFFDPNFGTAFFQDGADVDPLVLNFLIDPLRPNAWEVLRAVSSGEPGGLWRLGIVDLLAAFAWIWMVTAPALALFLLGGTLARMAGGAVRTWALATVLVAALSTLHPGYGPQAINFAVLLGHAGTGAVALAVLGFLLTRWLAGHGRTPGAAMSLGFASVASGLLVLGVILQWQLARLGMPRRYLDYPEAFAQLQLWNSLFMLALAAVIMVFLAAVVVRRFGPVTDDDSRVF